MLSAPTSFQIASVGETRSCREGQLLYMVSYVMDHQDSPQSRRIWNEPPECFPQRFPGKRRAGHEGVIPLAFDLHAKQGLQGAQQIGGDRRGEWNDDSQECVDKPDLPSFPLWGIGECLLERRE